jgi:hypothetical protein
MDRTHNDIGAKVSAVIDDAIADLMLIDPTQNRDDACKLMACLATIRIDDNEKRREVEQYASELVWDVDDTGGAVND